MVVVDLGFCPRCGGELESCEGSERHRSRCSVCGFVVSHNPLPVVAVTVVDGDRALFARRARAPEKNCWSLPGGYMEMDEAPEVGAARELAEETGLEVDPTDLEFVGTIYEPLDGRRAVVDLVFAAPLAKTTGGPAPGDDADELEFWSRAEIAEEPWNLRVGDIAPIMWAIETLGDDEPDRDTVLW